LDLAQGELRIEYVELPKRKVRLLAKALSHWLPQCVISSTDLLRKWSSRTQDGSNWLIKVTIAKLCIFLMALSSVLNSSPRKRRQDHSYVRIL